MVNSCIIAHTLFTLSFWKWGCRLQEPTLFKPTPNFDHPLLIHSSYSSGHYQRLNFISFFALLLQTSTPFFSVLCVPPCIPTHIHSRSAFPHHFNWIFSFPFSLPFWTNDLFCHEVGYFCCLSLLFFYFHEYSSCWCSLDYGDELPPTPLPPLWFLAAQMDKLMDKYVGGLISLQPTG